MVIKNPQRQKLLGIFLCLTIGVHLYRFNTNLAMVDSAPTGNISKK